MAKLITKTNKKQIIKVHELIELSKEPDNCSEGNGIPNN